MDELVNVMVLAAVAILVTLAVQVVAGVVFGVSLFAVIRQWVRCRWRQDDDNPPSDGR
jgi:hypothetical protein